MRPYASQADLATSTRRGLYAFSILNRPTRPLFATSAQTPEHPISRSPGALGNIEASKADSTPKVFEETPRQDLLRYFSLSLKRELFRFECEAQSVMDLSLLSTASSKSIQFPKTPLARFGRKSTWLMNHEMHIILGECASGGICR
jgi:hypothetical protein